MLLGVHGLVHADKNSPNKFQSAPRSKVLLDNKSLVISILIVGTMPLLALSEINSPPRNHFSSVYSADSDPRQKNSNEIPSVTNARIKVLREIQRLAVNSNQQFNG